MLPPIYSLALFKRKVRIYGPLQPDHHLPELPAVPDIIEIPDVPDIMEVRDQFAPSASASSASASASASCTVSYTTTRISASVQSGTVWLENGGQWKRAREWDALWNESDSRWTDEAWTHYECLLRNENQDFLICARGYTQSVYFLLRNYWVLVWPIC
jgi:hypothetical protein